MENKIMYANSVSVAITQYDCDVSFRTLYPIRDENGKISAGAVADSIDIVMSPQETKMLLTMLETQVKNYEEKYGHVDISKILQASPIKKAESQTAPKGIIKGENSHSSEV